MDQQLLITMTKTEDGQTQLKVERNNIEMIEALGALEMAKEYILRIGFYDQTKQIDEKFNELDQ